MAKITSDAGGMKGNIGSRVKSSFSRRVERLRTDRVKSSFSDRVERSRTDPETPAAILSQSTADLKG